MAILTFRDGHFILRLEQGDPLIAKLEKSHAWVTTSRTTFETEYLQAAVRFKTHADDVAKGVLDRTLARVYEVPSLPPLAFLDEHQREGVRWILSGSRKYLAHAPGAGKTATTIVATCLINSKRQALYIVPPHLTTNWVREIFKFTEQFNPWPFITVVHDSDKRHRIDWDAEFIVVAASMLARQWVLDGLLARDFKIVAVDEAHGYKDPTTARAKMLFGGSHKGLESPGLVQDAKHAVLLSGTPMPNRAIELWGPTIAMDPEAIDFMSHQDFGLRYGAARVDDYGRWTFPGTAREDELNLKLTKSFMHVVKEDRLDLPEHRRALVFMNGDPRSAELKAWERKNISRITFADIDENMSRGDLARYRREVGIGKISWTSELVGDLVENANQSVILFCWHREVAEGLRDRLKSLKPALVIGGTKDEYREGAFANFQLGKVKLLIGNIIAMGEGHNLPRADQNVFAEYAWSETANRQAEKRSHRRGRKGMLLSRYVVAGGTMDEIILNSVFAKEAATRKVIK